ncbi:Shedu anti-phage system protein SduA domain-containing protein [Streptomyces sp. NPDC102279]|uniref:Shedu anti-phage system protein SduA domain-containing protein n=1 Tax=Streptomyces sp. NPDC102279 TaxID=3366153 RepID=UPI003823661C
MSVRSDFSLELQVEKVLEEAAHPEVKAALASARKHMKSGKGGHRRGGQVLIQLLETARQRAADTGEWPVVRLVQDSLDYAEGRILQPDFDERYRLFQDGVRSETLRKHVGNILSINYRYITEAGREYMDKHPEASVDGLIAYFGTLSEDARFLDAPEDRPGRYRLLRGRAERAVWLERVLQERVDVEDAAEAAHRIVSTPEAIALLAADTEGQMVLRAAELHRRSTGLAALRKVVEDPTASELELQRALEGQHWIFGGRFVGEAAHRRLVPGDEVDIPLIRGDGALHVVELKRAASLAGNLVKKYRGSWVPTAEVHNAVGQAVNYLVNLDENRHRIRKELGIETRRASAVVLIGHPSVQPSVPEQSINEALRTLNTHVNRVEVLTYKELIDNAERSLGSVPLG